MDRTLSRRELLVLLSYAGLELTGTFSRTAFGSEKSIRKAFRRFAKQADLEPLRTVGRLYLESTSAEREVAELLHFFPDAETIDAEYWDAFTLQIRADFADGETVSLNGWVLSRSECRLYGLLHLVTS